MSIQIGWSCSVRRYFECDQQALGIYIWIVFKYVARKLTQLRRLGKVVKMSRLKKGRKGAGIRGKKKEQCVADGGKCGSASTPDGRDLRNTMWRWKGPLEPPEPWLCLKQECFVDKRSLRDSDGAFSRPLSCAALLPTPAPRHTLEPYTTMYVSTAIRVIADYIHNCLTQLCQTCINPQVFLHLV